MNFVFRLNPLCFDPVDHLDVIPLQYQGSHFCILVRWGGGLLVNDTQHSYCCGNPALAFCSKSFLSVSLKIRVKTMTELFQHAPFSVVSSTFCFFNLLSQGVTRIKRTKSCTAIEHEMDDFQIHIQAQNHLMGLHVLAGR